LFLFLSYSLTLFFFPFFFEKKFDFKEIAIKQIFEDQRFSVEDNKLKLEQEIAIIWAVSSHPNVLTLVGYCEDPLCIITKVFFFFPFPKFFSCIFFFSKKIKFPK